MDPLDEQKLREFLKRAAKPADGELRRNLWPAMLRRMERSEVRRVPWLDWALAAAVAASLLLAPRMIPVLLYHL